MHKLLDRQIRQHFGGLENLPPALKPFIDAIEQAYLQSDDDRAMLEHSMETVSDELVDRFRSLHTALADSQAAKTALDQAVSVLSATLESTTDGILVVDRAGHMVQMNRKFIELWRLPEHIIKVGDDEQAREFVLDQLADPEQFTQKVRDLYNEPDAGSFDEVLFKDGRIFERSSLPQRIGDEIAGRVWSFRDVTVSNQLEAQFRQSQKMEAVGALAGGIAHDFNNLLTVIRGNAEFLKDSIDPGCPEREDIDEITSAADRAAALTQQLLAFSRKQLLRPMVLDLNAVVASITPMLRRLIGEHIEIVLAPASGLGVISADRGQMEQVLLNLIVNARDAMPDGGHVRIEIEDIVLDDTHEDECAKGVPSGSFVRLTVSDTGHGISAEHLDRIFEPFFTTKVIGKGTGLGLSTVFGIVKQSGGYLLLESQLGHGATFRIYLPRVDQSPSAPQSEPAAPAMGGTETVLVVEDEDGVRSLVRRNLERVGYTVLAARDGAEARGLAAAHAGEIHLLLTDVIMPGTGGVALASQIRQLRPELRVLYMSGYTDEIVDHARAQSDGANLLEKPFTSETLTLAVRDAIDEALVERVH